MINNYIKIAWRNLISDKFNSLVSILGLVLGMTYCLITGLYVLQEWNYNQFVPDKEQIFHVKVNSLFNGTIATHNMSPAPLADALQSEVSQIAYASKYAYWGPKLLMKDQSHSVRENGIYASEGFFNIFPFPAIEGDPVRALAGKDLIVITRSLAQKLFQKATAVGESLMMLDQEEKLKSFIVGAVIEDIPANSSIQLDWVVSFKEIEQSWMHWGNASYHTWVKAHGHTTAEALNQATATIYAQHSDMVNTYPVFQSLENYHLYDVYENGVAVGGKIGTLRTVALIGFLILLISCINFISLVTARASARGKEIGIRKVIGADRSALMKQFLTESVLVSTVSLLLTLLVTALLIPLFNYYLDLRLSLDASQQDFWILSIGIWLLTLLLSSLYPSFYLSGLPAYGKLRIQLKPSLAGAYIRKLLIVFQFFVATLFLIAVLVIFSQLRYVMQKDLGVDRENALYMPMEGELYNNMEAVRQELLKSPHIESSTVATSLPINIQSFSSDLSWPGKDPYLQTQVAASWVGYDYLKTMGIKLRSGREFSPLHAGDSAAYMVNQAALDLMGIADPIGQEITFWNGPAPIIGVMEDFHLASLHHPIEPLVLVLEPLNSSYLFIRAREGQLAEAIADLKLVTQKFNPMYPFEYHFMDKDFERQYRAEQLISRLILLCGGTAIFISCLGLLGLVAFTASKRIKEIGIRKVLGASAAEITLMLSKSYLALMLLAWAIALPVGYTLLNRWLSNFAYKIDLEWWYFALAGLATLLIGLLTVSYQSIRAALSNPVESLRTE